MSILQLPIFQFADASGLLVGAKLYSFAGGSTVPKPLFHDNLLASQASNPVIADALGIFPELYMGSGAYRFQLYDQYDNLIATRDWVTSEGSGSGEIKNVQIESVAPVNCTTFRHLGGDLNSPHAIGAYFFAKDLINIKAISTIIPSMESMAAGNIQFAIYKPAYTPVTGGAVPMVGLSANVEMEKVASGTIQIANYANVYVVSGELEEYIAMQGWFCVVLSNTPSATWPSIYASANFSEMCSMLTPSETQYQVPLQFVRDDIVLPNEQTEDMWPDTINSLWGNSAHLLSKTIVPYIKVEIE